MPITITAKRDGFRRCNMRHPAKPITHPDGTFTEAELAILKADPALIVVDVADNAAATTATKPEGEALAVAIKAVITGLDKDRDYTTSGTPKVKSVEQALGYDITADEVATAFEQYTEDNG